MKFFINSILVDNIKKLPIFGIDIEEKTDLKEVSIFEKSSFNKYIQIKAYINNSEKQTIIQFLHRIMKDNLDINTYAYQSKQMLCIELSKNIGKGSMV